MGHGGFTRDCDTTANSVDRNLDLPNARIGHLLVNADNPLWKPLFSATTSEAQFSRLAVTVIAETAKLIMNAESLAQCELRCQFSEDNLNQKWREKSEVLTNSTSHHGYNFKTCDQGQLIFSHSDAAFRSSNNFIILQQSCETI